MRIHLGPVLFLLLLCAGSFLHAQQPAIIPQPVSTTWQNGHFLIDKHTVLVADTSENSSTGFFNTYLEEVYGFRLPVVAAGRQPTDNYILLSTAAGAPANGGALTGVAAFSGGGSSGSAGAAADGSFAEGGYSLKVSSGAITIAGATHSGTFYGSQTLFQLLPLIPYMLTSSGPAVRAPEGLSIPAVSIEDYPRFG